jgi:hypothetical protein
MAGGINVGRWLRKVTGKPVTAGNLFDLLVLIRSNPAVKESLEGKIKHELLLGADLERWERDLLEAAPGSAVLISTAFAAIRAAVTDWQL